MTQEDLKNVALLYQQKWQIQEAIRKCETLDALKAIEIRFTMADFTHD